MIVFNLSTEGDITNGTRGTVMDVILDSREGLLIADDENTIKLNYPPALILFKPDGGSEISSAFVDKREGRSIPVPNGQIPLMPCTVNFMVSMMNGKKFSIGRRQYALTGGYAFTDIKAQGQTIEVVVADMRNTPTGKILPFSAYVTLSQSHGCNTIRLLSDFDERLFKTHPDPDLEGYG